MTVTKQVLRRAALLALLAGAACSERQNDISDPAPDPAPAPGTVEVALSNFAFTAPGLTVDRGTTVRWRNTTATFHTVTPDGHTSFQEFQTSTSGEMFDVRFDQPGTYRYFCAPHRSLGMTGVIVVR